MIRALAFAIGLSLAAFALPYSTDCASTPFGSGWTLLEGGYNVTTGECRSTGGADINIITYTGDSLTGNHSITANLINIGTNPGICINLTGTGSGNLGGYCLFRIFSSDIGQVFEFNGAGGAAQIGSDYGVIADATNVRFYRDGNDLKVSYSGTPQATISGETTFTAGTAGLRAFNIAAFDNITIDNVAAAAAYGCRAFMLLGIGKC